MKTLKYVIIVIVLSVMINGCSKTSSRFQSSDPFYVSSGGRDFLRIPLIKPYDAIKGDEKHGWAIDLKESPSKNATYYISIKGVEKIAIENGIIMAYTSYKEESAEGLGEKVLYWFVLNHEKGIEKGFDNEKDFLIYVKNNEIGDPDWLVLNESFRQFEKTGCLKWIPDCNPSK